MKHFWLLISARNKEYYRDLGVLGWSLVFPVLVILGFGFAFRSDNQILFKAMIHGTPTPKTALSEFHAIQTVQWVEAPSVDDALPKLRRHAVDLVLDTESQPPRYWINESSPKGYLLEKLLRGTGAPVERGTVSGKEIRYVDWLISGLLGMNMMFSALFGVGYTLVRYRKNGVLKRLKATPVGAFEFLSAQVVSRLFIIGLSSAVVYAGCHALVKFTMLGSYWHLAVVLMSGAYCLTSLGLLVAARISSEEFAGGLLNVLTWPMIFLSGVWFSLEGAAPWLKKVASAFPLTPVIEASRLIMTEGATLSQVQPQVATLLVLGTVFLVSGAALFRWK